MRRGSINDELKKYLTEHKSLNGLARFYLDNFGEFGANDSRLKSAFNNSAKNDGEKYDDYIRDLKIVIETEKAMQMP